MKARNIIAGLGLLVATTLAGCVEARSWQGTLKSLPSGYQVFISQRKNDGRILESELRISKIGAQTGLVYAVDGNGDGKFDSQYDMIRFIGMDNADAGALAPYAHAGKMTELLAEALPNAVNNPAYQGK